MIALKVCVNDGVPITGGAADLGVLNVIINAVGKLGVGTQGRDGMPVDLHVRMGGLTARAPGSANEHMTWLEHEILQVGDIVRVELVEVEAVDPPLPARQPEDRELKDRVRFDQAKQTYFAMRERFEGPQSPAEGA